MCLYLLLQSMLCLDPTKRITARSAVEHEYFKDIKFVPWFLIFMAKVFINMCRIYGFWLCENACYLGIFFYAWDSVTFQFCILSLQIFQNQLECELCDQIAHYLFVLSKSQYSTPAKFSVCLCVVVVVESCLVYIFIDCLQTDYRLKWNLFAPK